MPTPAPAPDRASPSPPAPPAPVGARRASRDRDARRGRLIGALATLAVHTLLFLLLRAAAVQPPLGSAQAPVEREAPTGMRVLQVTEVADAAAPAERAPPQVVRPRVVPAPPAPVPAPPARAAPAPRASSGPPPVGADRIAAGPRDPRLWRMPEAVRPVDLTPEDVRRIELLAALSQLGDSLAADQLAALARFDWTVKDDAGGRWGVTPGWLHLGDISIPLPLNFVTPTLGTGSEGRVAEWEEIQAQARRLGTEAELKERIKALRDRKDAEREKRRSGNGG